MAVYLSDVGAFGIVKARSLMNNSRFTPKADSAVAAPAEHHRSGSSFTLRAKLGVRSTESVDYEQFFLSQRPVLERVVAEVCRRNHLFGPEREDFESEVTLHLIARDYHVLRQFKWRSSVHTYFTVVVQRQFVNYRNRLWGRWRPSAEATRLGAVAILLERLIVRDEWSFEEAQEQMRANHGVGKTRAELYELSIHLSAVAPTRHMVSPDEAENVPSPDLGPDARLDCTDCRFTSHRVRLALDRARKALTAEEQVLLKMRFDDGFTVRRIAEVLHARQKPLYRTFDRLLLRLKQHLLDDGISADDIRNLFGDTDQDPGGKP
jgi:RNA polymerase sigma factor (sigma-70 family)